VLQIHPLIGAKVIQNTDAELLKGSNTMGDNQNDTELLSMPSAPLPSDDDSTPQEDNVALDEHQTQELAAEIEKLKIQLKDELLALVQHPATPDFFKNHPIVKEMIE
jgi:hypothetical protein